MRCPECQQRNSVAAWKCKFCGAKFKRKQMSTGKKLALFGVSALVGGSIYLIFALPKMIDPAEQLISVAKKVASGPRSPEDAKKSREAFNDAIKNMLQRYGDSNSNALSQRLKACLPPNGPFEVLVVDLPKGLKLVEVDTVLQASDFLVMKGTNETKVIPLPNFEVYDDARAVNDQTGTVIVLIGHTSGQLPHKPIIQTYALLPDSVVDETASMVPSIAGEGQAKFIKDTSNIEVELTLPSVAAAEKITMNPPLAQEKTVHIRLDWKDAKYQASMDFPQDLHSSMMLLARALKYPDLQGSVNAAFGQEGGKLMKENASPAIQDLSVQKSDDKKKALVYLISSPEKNWKVELKKAGSNWQIASFSASETQAADSSNVKSKDTKSTVGNDKTLSENALSENTTGTKNAAVSTDQAAQTNATDTKQALVSQANKNTNDAGKNPNTGSKSAAPDLLAGLRPEKAGSHVKENDKQAKSQKSQESPEDNKSSWLDDDKKNDKPPVAVLPPGLKNQNDDKSKQPQSDTLYSAGVSEARIADYLGTNSVRMRSGPGLSNKAIDEIPRGAKIQILGQTSGWYKVSYAGKTGYVFGPLVDTKTGDTKTGDTKTGDTKKSAAAGNSGAGSSGSGATIVRAMTVRDERRRAISSVRPGQNVVVLSGPVNNRYKIRTSDGTVGYVHKDAIQHVKVETPPEFVP